MSLSRFLFFPILIILSLNGFQAARAADSKTVFASDHVIEDSFLDQASASEMLVLTRNGKASRVRISDQKLLKTYENQCGLRREEETAQPPAFAYPLLVSWDRTCYFDERSGALEKLPDNDAPKDVFYIAFLSQDQRTFHFLMNSRPWGPGGFSRPEDAAGFIHVKSVNLDSHQISIRLLVDQVPGYSGAMALSEDFTRFHYTEATGSFSNRLHMVPTSELLNLVKMNQKTAFGKIAKYQFEFPGLSLWMSVGSKSLLYGSTNGSYLIRKQGEKTELPSGRSCAAVSLYKAQALIQCDHRSIRLADLDSVISGNF